MSEVAIIPELRQIIGAILFAAKKPVTSGEIVSALKATAKDEGGAAADFAEVTKKDVEAVIEAFRADMQKGSFGFQLVVVAGGYRLQNDVGCGPWLRQYLQKGRGSRLTRPSLETLAIIAYRQPCTRSEIEAVRGVAVDQIVRNLLEMQLIKVSGRSELPGRPWLFGTTQKFLEHFGLTGVDDLPGVDELRRMDEKRAREQESAAVEEEPVDPQEELFESAPGVSEAPADEEKTSEEDAEEAFEDEDEVDEDEESDDEEDYLD